MADEAARIAQLEAEVAALRKREAALTVENVALREKGERGGRALVAALEQQTATAEVLRVIASSPTDEARVLEAIVVAAERLTDSGGAIIQRRHGDTFVEVAMHGESRRRVEAFMTESHAIRFSRNSISGRAVLERRTIHLPDIVAAVEMDYPDSRANIPHMGQRSQVTVPLLRDDHSLGVLTVHRFELRPFTEQQIALLETFADQAVIAIENARLFEEVEQRNRELSAALEQQTATAEVLRVIASSPADLDRMLNEIASSAMSLTGAGGGGIWVVEGEQMRIAARQGVYATQTGPNSTPTGYTLPISRDLNMAGRAILEARRVYSLDLQNDPEFPLGQAHARANHTHTTLVVPLLREGAAVGAMIVARTEIQAFTDVEITLLETFADQAVIALENARLFEELERRNAELSVALEQQTATSEILRVIASSPSAPPHVLDAIASAAARFTDSEGAAIQQVFGERLRWVGRYGRARQGAEAAEAGGLQGNVISADTMSGRALLERRTIHVPDVAAVVETDFPDSDPGYRFIQQRSQVTLPLLREGQAVGVLGVFRWAVRPFTEQQIALLESFADQAVIAIENARLFEELERRTRDLAEALEDHTATGDILRVISRMPTDVQPVLDAIVERAARLCDADDAIIQRLDGDHVMNVAGTGKRYQAALNHTLRVPVIPGTVSGRVILERRTIHVDDVMAASAEFPDSQTFRNLTHHRTQASTPLLRDGEPLGVLGLYRYDVRPFTDRQVGLLETFAAQAVIAIENTRLFEELRDRTHELTRSVAELRALGEVSQAISSSLDLPTVLTTIVANATRLSGADSGIIYEFDDVDGVFVLRASHQTPDDLAAALQAAHLRLGEGVVGRAGAARAPFEVANVEASAIFTLGLRDLLLTHGHRSVLAVPLLRDEQVLGGLVMARRVPGAFPAEVVALLQTFATQSALAIHNGRLYQALQEASRHKSAFLANMSHELRTPLNAIIGYSEMLQEEAEDIDADAFLPDLQRINGAGKHLLGLINDILDLSKIEAGRMDLYLESFDFSDLIRDVRGIVQPLVEKNGNTLLVHGDDALGTMHADQTKVRQALFNLLSNAAKFTDHGTISLTVQGESDDWITFVVKDTGIGMTEEQLGRLFEAFSQAEASTRSQYGGTGLGLAISRHFCRLMGGDLTVSSVQGEGATFTVRLPAVVRDPTEQTRQSGTP